MNSGIEDAHIFPTASAFPFTIGLKKQVSVPDFTVSPDLQGAKASTGQEWPAMQPYLPMPWIFKLINWSIVRSFIPWDCTLRI
jgi:hypothetical protein